MQPLYNLEFHALLPTVVTDGQFRLSLRLFALLILSSPAGTDQKVAKFLKRGVDVLGLAVLDPIDLATPPTSPALSPAVSASHASPPTESPSSFLNRFKRISFKPPATSKSKSLTPSTSISDGLTSNGSAVLPLLRTPSNTDASRPAPPPNAVRGYAFTVRKWTRRDLEGTKEGADAAQQLRFEWRRATKRPKKRRSPEDREPSRPSIDRRGSAGSVGGGSPAKSRSRTRVASSRRQETLTGEDLTEDPNNLCAPGGRRKSVVTGGSRPSSMHSHSDVEHSAAPTDGEEEEEDDGVESDPEDSERPWTCHLVQSPSGFGAPSPLASRGPNIRRLHLGTLIPAPHHPKLVGTLSVPFNLSPVALGTPQAGGTWGAREGLSVEEMKDCLSVSCLWVVVREGLGGLAGAKAGLGGSQLKPKMLKEGWKLGR